MISTSTLLDSKIYYYTYLNTLSRNSFSHEYNFNTFKLLNVSVVIFILSSLAFKIFLLKSKLNFWIHKFTKNIIINVNNPNKNANPKKLNNQVTYTMILIGPIRKLGQESINHLNFWESIIMKLIISPSLDFWLKLLGEALKALSRIKQFSSTTERLPTIFYRVLN